MSASVRVCVCMRVTTEMIYEPIPCSSMKDKLTDRHTCFPGCFASRTLKSQLQNLCEYTLATVNSKSACGVCPVTTPSLTLLIRTHLNVLSCFPHTAGVVIKRWPPTIITPSFRRVTYAPNIQLLRWDRLDLRCRVCCCVSGLVTLHHVQHVFCLLKGIGLLQHLDKVGYGGYRRGRTDGSRTDLQVK